jgi:5'(3')-deoxyribonucleotidase
VRLYIDCDGVLADFDGAFMARFGTPSRDYESKEGANRFWQNLEAEPEFYRRLPVFDGAADFMETLRPLRPIILTGCPLGTWAYGQKIEWAAEHFPGVPMVCTRSKDKRLFCRLGDVLVDDWLKYRELWEEAGGTFVHHVGDFHSTLLSIPSERAE